MLVCLVCVFFCQKFAVLKTKMCPFISSWQLQKIFVHIYCSYTIFKFIFFFEIVICTTGCDPDIIEYIFGMYQMTSPVPYHSPKKLQSHHHICVPFLEKEFWIYSICRNKHACSRKKRTLTLSTGLALFIWSQSFEDIIENL